MTCLGRKLKREHGTGNQQADYTQLHIYIAKPDEKKLFHLYSYIEGKLLLNMDYNKIYQLNSQQIYIVLRILTEIGMISGIMKAGII